MKTFSKIFAAGFFSLTALSAGYAQNKSAGAGGNGTVTMPSAPAMPSVSAPAVGNGFYVPGSAGFYTGQKNVPAATPQKSQEENSEAISAEKSASTAAASAAATVSPATPKISDIASYSAQSAVSNLLTASQISSMDQMGLMGNFSSLLGKNEALLSKSNGSEQLILQQILTQLEDLKKRLPENGSSAGTSGNEASVNSRNPAEKESSVFRFLINGYNVLGSCKTIYISKPENDGSFLLTGDRKYAADGIMREETFYFLFLATGTKNSSTVYTVTPSISQDYENTSSLFYRLCHAPNLTAFKTGNLVTLKYDNGVKADLLIGLE